MQPVIRLARRQPSSVRHSFYVFRATASRPFSIAQQLRIKEDSQRSPGEIEKVKQEQIKKQEKGEGHWHRELASSSEDVVGAAREKVDDHGEHMKDLQKETAGQHEKEHSHGKAEH